MISCQRYDDIELVCLYHYLIRLMLASGETIEGTALDTARNAKKEECIKLSQENGDTLVVLDSIRRLEVLVENPHLKQVDFP